MKRLIGWFVSLLALLAGSVATKETQPAVELIMDVSPAAATYEVVLAEIPQDYTHLELVVLPAARERDRHGRLFVQLNDIALNYFYEGHYADQAAAQMEFGEFDASGSYSSVYRVQFPFYKDAVRPRTIQVQGSYNPAGGGVEGPVSVAGYADTIEPITSLNITSNGVAFTETSRFMLYGIR
jgi:hypothetical protein